MCCVRYLLSFINLVFLNQSIGEDEESSQIGGAAL